MSAGTKHFLYQSAGDWRGGICGGAEPEADGLMCRSSSGWYISAPLDSEEAGTCWHRLRIEAKLPENTQLDVWVITGESDGDTDAYLRDPEVSEDAKRAFFRRYGRHYANALDIPLFSSVGRYLWFRLELFSHDGRGVLVRSIKVEFPRVAFVDYLPQLYREGERDSFLARFLMIFQSLYVDYEEKLERTPELFTPDAAPKEYVDWMADWFGLRDAADWREDTLRALLPHASRLCRSKGTCAAIRFLVRSYTGEEPLLIEQFDVTGLESAAGKRDVLARLYGESGRAFTVLVSRAAAPDDVSRRSLLRLLRYASPVDAICRLAVLPEGLTLDTHCYIGMNTCLPERATGGIGKMELM